MRKKLVFIHPGKCGGTSIAKAIRASKYRAQYESKDYGYSHIHTRRVRYDKNSDYIIALRNPIARMMSAWNWRKRCLYTMNKPPCKGEYLTFQSYSSLNDIGEQLCFPNGNKRTNVWIDLKRVGHMQRGIAFHTNLLIDHLYPEHTKVITQEYLQEDLLAAGIECKEFYLRDNRGYDECLLSEQAVINLVKFARLEYEAIDKMNDNGILTPKQYEVLSSKTYPAMRQ